MWRWEDGERGTLKSTGRSESLETSWRGGGVGGPADLKKTKGQGHEHLCDTGMPVRNGNLGTDRTTTTKATSVRKQLGTKNSKSNEGSRWRMVELREETGVQRSLTERLVRSRLQWAGHVDWMEGDRQPKRAAELREQDRRRRGRPRLRWEDCVKRCEEGGRGGRLEEEDKKQRRVEKTIR